ncbi:MAG TPA: hypothetical protein VK747_12920, partial [Blastocatellia bacterium]|nr:hypothetical protein [Blastocatellia bacterium]
LMDRHFITHAPNAVAALLSLLRRVANTTGASAHARKVRAHYVSSKRERAKRSRCREFVATRW